jgi:hypothetical protein
MTQGFKFKGAVLSGLLMAAVCLVATAPAAQASLIADGVTYTLTEASTSSQYVDEFTLSITGINGPLDTEGGRYGVLAFAFNQPSNFLSATATGFTERPGGLNANGCNGKGNFFCLNANTAPANTVLTAGSSLSFVFDVTISSGDFSTWDPDFKIEWAGSKNGYDLVSLSLTPTISVNQNQNPAPEPATLAVIGSALAGLGAARRRHRRSA